MRGKQLTEKVRKQNKMGRGESLIKEGNKARKKQLAKTSTNRGKTVVKKLVKTRQGAVAYKEEARIKVSKNPPAPKTTINSAIMLAVSRAGRGHVAAMSRVFKERFASCRKRCRNERDIFHRLHLGRIVDLSSALANTPLNEASLFNNMTC